MDAKMEREINTTSTTTINRQRIKPVGVTYTDTHVLIQLVDERILGVPFALVSYLEGATPEQRDNYELWDWAVYFPDFEDGIDLESLLSGQYL